MVDYVLLASFEYEIFMVAVLYDGGHSSMDNNDNESSKHHTERHEKHVTCDMLHAMCFVLRAFINGQLALKLFHYNLPSD